MTDRRDTLLVQVPGWLLLFYLACAQAPAAFDYEIGVRMGTQEPAKSITEVGAAFWYGFAFADLVVYIPFLAAGLIGYRLGTRWGRGMLAAALGVTVYWPVVVLAAAVDARDAAGWTIDETPYWIVLSIIFTWALLALFRIVLSRPDS
jgi:hypothetical protein